MTLASFDYHAALRDFQNARQQAALQEIIARLTGKSAELLSYEDVAHKLKLSGRAERGIQEIPIDAIVGSVGRYTDFTRTFLPRHDSDQDRWTRLKSYSEQNAPSLPPIDVYQVGEVYFVLDGNHRVSIARQYGMPTIDAHVIEVHTAIPLTPDVEPDDLLVKAEYADFLEKTCLSDLRPGFDLCLTAPGQYTKLTDHIEIHRYLMQAEQNREIAFVEAAAAWYDEVYLPLALAIRDFGLLRWFTGRTETDLYLWVWEHRAALEQELGWAIRPEAAVTDLAVRKNAQAGSEASLPGTWRKAKITQRYTEQLFQDILVPLNGAPECWTALDQAIAIAQRENAQLQGLHLVGSEAQKAGASARVIQARFNQRCAEVGVAGRMVIEAGDVTRKICERALLADLVVLSLMHPPGVGLSSLSSGLRSLVWRCARPILAVPSAAAPLDRALLAYDGSPKAKEALFVATYLAEMWHTALTVITLLDGTRVGPGTQDYARAYLDLHEVPAEFILTDGHFGLAIETLATRQMNLAIIGGYSVSALEEVLIGSAVNFLLRNSPCPVLICR
jgi:nucleotide-binding universal stress UspA family protein